MNANVVHVFFNHGLTGDNATVFIYGENDFEPIETTLAGDPESLVDTLNAIWPMWRDLGYEAHRYVHTGK
jgi:hypothetical protein